MSYLDLLYRFLDIYGRLLIGALFVEWGLCRWQNRKFIKKNILTFFILGVGVYYMFVTNIRDITHNKPSSEVLQHR